MPSPGRTEKVKKFTISVLRIDVVHADQTSMLLSDVVEFHTDCENPLTFFSPFRRSWVVNPIMVVHVKTCSYRRFNSSDQNLKSRKKFKSNHNIPFIA